MPAQRNRSCLVAIGGPPACQENCKVDSREWKRGTGSERNQHGPCRRTSRLGACPPFPRCPSVAARRKGTGTIGTANPYSHIDRRRSQSPFSGSRTLCSSPDRRVRVSAGRWSGDCSGHRSTAAIPLPRVGYTNRRRPLPVVALAQHALAYNRSTTIEEGDFVW